MESLALTLCKVSDLRVRDWNGPFGDVGVEWRETWLEGSREWEEAEKERCTGYLHQSFLNHTTRGPIGVRDERLRIKPSSQTIPLQEAEREQSAQGGTTG